MTTFPDVVDEFPDATTLAAQTLDEADHAQLHENLGVAISATQTFVAGVSRVLKFPFTFDTPNLLTGAAVYTPTIGDLLMDAWITVTEAFDGTTPKGDLCSVGVSGGLFAQIGGAPVDLTLVPNGVGNIAAVGVGAHLAIMAAISAVGGSLFVPAIESVPVPLQGLNAPYGYGGNSHVGTFMSTDPVTICATSDGTASGDDPGSTQGAAVLHLVICTPADG